MDPNSFGQRLKAFRECAQDVALGKPKLTQDRLGELLGQKLGMAPGREYTGSAVSLWEYGRNKIGADDRHVLVALVQVLADNEGVKTLAEADDLLEAGNYRALNEAEGRQVLPKRASASGAEGAGPQPGRPRDAPPESWPIDWPLDIPNEPYYALRGREAGLGRLFALLERPDGPPVVAIDGLGGLGKTAIAAELARRLWQRGGWEGIVGDSAKQELFQGGEIVRLAEASLDFDGLLDAIGRQLDRWDLLTLNPVDKRAEMARLLRGRHLLILVDNLETADNADALVIQLRGLLGRSRAILTSRKKAPHDFVQPLSLGGLELEDATAFLKADAYARQAQQILTAPPDLLAEINAIAGGAPLALKLVVAQTLFLDLEQVMRGLRQAQGDLYPFIFRQSWEQLSLAAQRVLIYIGRTVVTTVGWEELAAVGVTDNETELATAIRLLVAYSLMEVTHVAGQVRYRLHALTSNFINGDLPNLWGTSGPI